jgi:hypothetical protein
MSFKSIVVSDKDDKKLNRVTLYKNKDKATLKDTGKMFTELFGVTSFEYKKKKKTKARYAWINQETIIV